MKELRIMQLLNELALLDGTEADAYIIAGLEIELAILQTS